MRWGGTPPGEPLRFNEPIMLNGLVFWIILLLVFMAAYAWVRRRTAASMAMPPGQAGVPLSAISDEACGVLEMRFTPVLGVVHRRSQGKKPRDVSQDPRDFQKRATFPTVTRGGGERSTPRGCCRLFGSLEKRIDWLWRKKART